LDWGFSGWIETLKYSGLTRRDGLDCLMQDDLLSVLDSGEGLSRAYLKFLDVEKKIKIFDLDNDARRLGRGIFAKCASETWIGRRFLWIKCYPWMECSCLGCGNALGSSEPRSLE
jgi:hypothetical protein